MRRSIRNLLATGFVLTVLLAVAGCAPKLTVESNMQPGYRADLQRVYVVLDIRQLEERTRLVHFKGGEFEAEVSDTTSFKDDFLPALKTEFATAGVELQMYRITGLELSSTALDEAIAEYAPDGVLWIDESHMGILRDPGFLGIGATETLTAIDLDAFVYEKHGDDNAVWRATLSIESGYGGVPEMARVMAQSIVGKLVEDGLITP